jgi:tetratricopeptide (TPR) repeat protein
MAQRSYRCLIVVVALAALSLPLCAAPASNSLDPEGWQRLQTGQFEIYSNAGEARTREIAERLLRLEQVIAHTTDLETRSTLPIKIFIFRHSGAFAPLREALFGPGGKKTSGVFIGHADGNYIAINASADQRSYGLIYHELIHLFLNNSMPRAPLWFNEGLGEFYSTFSNVGTRVTVGSRVVPHVRWLRRTVRQMPLEQLLTLTNSSEEYRKGTRQEAIYAESWLLVHYLMMNSDRTRAQLKHYLSIVDEMGVEKAFPLAFGMSVEGMERELRLYARRNAYPAQIMTMSALPRGGVSGESTPVAPDDVLAHLGEFLARGDRQVRGTARRFLQEALSRNPDNVTAHLAFGYLEDREGSRDVAAGHYDAVLATRPPGALPYLLAGELKLRMLMARYPRPQEAPAAAVQEVRSLFTTASERAPNMARAWTGLGKSYLFEPEAVAQGIEALSKSFSLNPSIDPAVHLVAFCASVGDREKALHYLSELQKLGAEEDVLTRARDSMLNADLRNANRLLREGKDGEAVAVLERLRGEARSPEMQASLARDVERIRTQMQQIEQTLRFNSAVDRANSGDYAEAMRILDGIELSIASSDVQRATAQLRNALTQRLAARGR